MGSDLADVAGMVDSLATVRGARFVSRGRLDHQRRERHRRTRTGIACCAESVDTARGDPVCVCVQCHARVVWSARGAIVLVGVVCFLWLSNNPQLLVVPFFTSYPLHYHPSTIVQVSEHPPSRLIPFEQHWAST